ncbi:hypothetical protein D3C85_1573360 [compost metagenome]
MIKLVHLCSVRNQITNDVFLAIANSAKESRILADVQVDAMLHQQLYDPELLRYKRQIKRT